MSGLVIHLGTFSLLLIFHQDKHLCNIYFWWASCPPLLMTHWVCFKIMKNHRTLGCLCVDALNVEHCIQKWLQWLTKLRLSQALERWYIWSPLRNVLKFRRGIPFTYFVLLFICTPCADCIKKDRRLYGAKSQDTWTRGSLPSRQEGVGYQMH